MFLLSFIEYQYDSHFSGTNGAGAITFVLALEEKAILLPPRDKICLYSLPSLRD